MAKTLALTIELYPSFMYGHGLRKIAKGRWERIRKAIIAERGLVCEICDFAPTELRRLIQAHEVFEYDIPARAVRLQRIQLLCTRCHHCKHIDNFEFMRSSGILGELTREQLVTHFCRVNRCQRRTFDKHLAAATDRLRDLVRAFGTSSLPDAQVDYGVYQTEVEAARLRSEAYWQRVRENEEEERADDSDPLPDHECFWTPDGELYGHRS